jgi:hypothetical protein
VNEGRKEVTEKLAKLMEREYKVRVKEEQLERREEGLEEERKKEETRVKVMRGHEPKSSWKSLRIRHARPECPVWFLN